MISEDEIFDVSVREGRAVLDVQVGLNTASPHLGYPALFDTGTSDLIVCKSILEGLQARKLESSNTKRKINLLGGRAVESEAYVISLRIPEVNYSATVEAFALDLSDTSYKIILGWKPVISQLDFKHEPAEVGGNTKIQFKIPK